MVRKQGNFARIIFTLFAIIAASSKLFTMFEKRRRRGTRKLYLGSSLVIAVLIVCHQGSMG
ncbi:MAG: hypothetical protein BRC54_10840, partial [Cyanobacteria bacterium SW_7_48_12]